MTQPSLFSLPIEIRAQILKHAVGDKFDGWSDTFDDRSYRALMRTSKPISDELFSLLIRPDQHISLRFYVSRRHETASKPWLSPVLLLEFTRPNMWASRTYKLHIQDLDDPKIRALVRHGCVLDTVDLDIEVPHLPAQGNNISQEMAVVWSKVRDTIKLTRCFRSVERVECHFNTRGCKKLALHRFFICPIKVNQTPLGSLHSLIIGALAEPFIKYSPSTDKSLSKPFISVDYIRRSYRSWSDCNYPPVSDQQAASIFHQTARIAKTVRKGICIPQSLPERLLARGEDFPTLSEHQVLELRHELRSLSIAVDAIIDTCLGRFGNMLRLHRFATWNCSESNSLSAASQHTLLRGAGPNDQTISNRETLMELLKPAECDDSSYPVDTWYRNYPDGIPPLDLLAKQHRERFEEEPEFYKPDVAHSED
ncbi:hypothetical protein PG995_014964 [Apiospora arundinis]